MLGLHVDPYAMYMASDPDFMGWLEGVIEGVLAVQRAEAERIKAGG
jgi:hypothetical protein